MTIAASRPRNEAECIEKIKVACERQGVAEKAQYEYAKGGTTIVGPTIRLLELIAQKWGNIDFSFRELVRHEGRAGLPGESVVEAFAWDMESNTRRRVQFVVPHAMATKKGRKILTDDREIYEYIANMAQRRVRTCLENVIPRDVIDTAVETCTAALKARITITPELIKRVVAAFAEYGVTKDMLEEKLQRKIDAISPAQVVSLGRIKESLKDGVANVEDFFDVAQPEESSKPKTAAEKAMDAMGGVQKPAQAPAQAAEPQKQAEPEKPAPRRKQARTATAPQPAQPIPVENSQQSVNQAVQQAQTAQEAKQEPLPDLKPEPEKQEKPKNDRFDFDEIKIELAGAVRRNQAGLVKLIADKCVKALNAGQIDEGQFNELVELSVPKPETEPEYDDDYQD